MSASVSGSLHRHSCRFLSLSPGTLPHPDAAWDHTDIGIYYIMFILKCSHPHSLQWKTFNKKFTKSLYIHQYMHKYYSCLENAKPVNRLSSIIVFNFSETNIIEGLLSALKISYPKQFVVLINVFLGINV